MELLPAEIGDQIRAHRQAFYNSGYSACFKCGAQDLGVTTNPTGISAADEEVGIDVFTCNRCPWATSFKWSSAYPQRYTEPVDGKWQRTMLGYPTRWVQLWCQRSGLGCLSARVGSGSVDGTKMMDWERRGSLPKELGLTDPEAERLLAAMKGRDFSLKG